jgi:phenylacetate-CoA ligase
MLDIIKKIYFTLPIDRLSFLKYLPNSVLYGKSYRQCQPAFDTGLLLPNLFCALTYARDNTVFWSTKIPKNLCLENTLETYDKLPTISSFDLANNLSDYTSKRFTRLNAYLATTGGTGRNPTSIMLSNESFGIEWAHIHKVWSEIGYKKKKNSKLTIVGKRLREAQLISRNPIYNELIVDFFKINDSNFDELAKSQK